MEKYQFRSEMKNLDIQRVLHENYADGYRNFVFITVKDSGLVFFSKKFANKLIKHSILIPNPVQEDGTYGFGFSTMENNSKILNNSVKGSLIISQGFTHFFPIFCKTEVNTILLKIKELEDLEKREIESNKYLEKVSVIGG